MFFSQSSKNPLSVYLTLFVKNISCEAAAVMLVNRHMGNCFMKINARETPVLLEWILMGQRIEGWSRWPLVPLLTGDDDLMRWGLEKMRCWLEVGIDTLLSSPTAWLRGGPGWTQPRGLLCLLPEGGLPQPGLFLSRGRGFGQWWVWGRGGEWREGFFLARTQGTEPPQEEEETLQHQQEAAFLADAPLPVCLPACLLYLRLGSWGSVRLGGQK